MGTLSGVPPSVRCHHAPYRSSDRAAARRLRNCLSSPPSHRNRSRRTASHFLQPLVQRAIFRQRFPITISAFRKLFVGHSVWTGLAGILVSPPAGDSLSTLRSCFCLRQQKKGGDGNTLLRYLSIGHLLEMVLSESTGLGGVGGSTLHSAFGATWPRSLALFFCPLESWLTRRRAFQVAFHSSHSVVYWHQFQSAHFPTTGPGEKMEALIGFPKVLVVDR